MQKITLDASHHHKNCQKLSRSEANSLIINLQKTMFLLILIFTTRIFELY